MAQPVTVPPSPMLTLIPMSCAGDCIRGGPPAASFQTVSEERAAPLGSVMRSVPDGLESRRVQHSSANQIGEPVLWHAKFLAESHLVIISDIVQFPLRRRVNHHIAESEFVNESICALCASIFKFVQIMSAAFFIECIENRFHREQIQARDKLFFIGG